MHEKELISAKKLIDIYFLVIQFLIIRSNNIICIIIYLLAYCLKTSLNNLSMEIIK